MLRLFLWSLSLTTDLNVISLLPLIDSIVSLLNSCTDGSSSELESQDFEKLGRDISIFSWPHGLHFGDSVLVSSIYTNIRFRFRYCLSV
ncbi:hypothetical protein F0562_013522 [Nyssa sinensis]|uniref:Secreted protein n=1 Tax=Nyssa sinensis TaxID=561372 RepID=A0A5J4ZNJ5_9ASTE|nr:hypothetical protein F0562_013522 [Nyssa sinensis]